MKNRIIKDKNHFFLIAAVIAGICMIAFLLKSGHSAVKENTNSTKKTIQDAIGYEGNPASSALLSKGTEALNNNNYNQAFEIFSNMISENNNTYQAYIYRSKVYFDLQFYEKAHKDIEKAIEMYPQKGEAYRYRGIYYASELDDRAIDDFSKYLESEPYDFEIFYRRGMYYYYRKQQDLARTDLEKAKQLDNSGKIGILATNFLEDIRIESDNNKKQ